MWYPQCVHTSSLRASSLWFVGKSDRVSTGGSPDSILWRVMRVREASGDIVVVAASVQDRGGAYPVGPANPDRCAGAVGAANPGRCAGTVGAPNPGRCAHSWCACKKACVRRVCAGQRPFLCVCWCIWRARVRACGSESVCAFQRVRFRRQTRRELTRALFA